MTFRMGAITICFILIFSTPALLTGQQELGEEIADIPFFNLSLISLDGNPSREQWVNFTAIQLPKIGINVDLNYDLFFERSFHYEADPITGIPTYENGGYDLLAIGEGRENIFTFLSMDSFSENLSPCPGSGVCNFYWYQNQEIFDLYAEGFLVKDPSRMNELRKEFQEILYEEVPTMVLYEQGKFLWAKKSLGMTFSKSQAIALGVLQDGWKSIGTQNNLTIAAPYGVSDNNFNPLGLAYTQPNFEDYHAKMVWQGLLEQDPSDLTNLKPLLAKSLPTWNENYTVATIDLRTDVVFADGHPLDATDVVETYRMLLTPEVGSLSYFILHQDKVQAFVGDGKFATWTFLDNNDSIIAVDADTVQFTFNSSLIDYGGENLIFTSGIVPEHIFGNHTHPTVTDYDFETAVRNQTSVYGIGTGPYVFKEINSSTDLISLSKNPNYWNGNVNVDEIHLVKERETETAFQKLVSGEYDMLSHWYWISPLDFENTDQVDVFNIPLAVEFGLNQVSQEIAFNHNHPIFGTGVDTPLGQADPTKAAMAAKYVRQAMNHAMPRQFIIDEFLGGYGVPGTTKVMSVHAPADLNIIPYEYNLTKSMELLKMAGYTNETSPNLGSPDEPERPFLSLDNDLLLISLGILAVATLVIVGIKRKS